MDAANSKNDGGDFELARKENYYTFSFKLGSRLLTSRISPSFFSFPNVKINKKLYINQFGTIIVLPMTEETLTKERSLRCCCTITSLVRATKCGFKN